MKLNSAVGMLIFITLLAVTALSYSNSPPENTIPIVSMKTGQDSTCDDITLDNLCMLLWHNFDGIWVEGWLNGKAAPPAELCDSTSAIMILAPGRLQELSNSQTHRWGRFPVDSLQDDSAFIHPDSLLTTIVSTRNATSMSEDIQGRCVALRNQADDYDCIWYYDMIKA